MKSNQFLKRWCYAGCVALCTALFTVGASASDPAGWLVFPYNLYGIGGDRIEAAAAPVSANTGSLKFWPMAAVGGYSVKDRFGITEFVSINSADQVSTNFIFGYIGSPLNNMITAAAYLTDQLAVTGDRRYTQWTSWAVFMTVQSSLVCGSNNAWSSPMDSNSSGRGTPPGSEGNNYQGIISMNVCPDGSLPVTAQAVYTQGIRNADRSGIHLIN